VQKGLNQTDTHELKSIVDQDNADGCGSFWTEPIDNTDETRGLSAKTSWRVKGKYISEPLNNIHAKYVGSEQRTTPNSEDKTDKILPQQNTHNCPKVSLSTTSERRKVGKENIDQRKVLLRNNHVSTNLKNSKSQDYSSPSIFKPISKNKSQDSVSPNFIKKNQRNVNSWTHSNPPRILKRPNSNSSSKKTLPKTPKVVPTPRNTFVPRKLLVYRIEKDEHDNSQIYKFWIDRTKSFPVHSNLSRGPKQFWVPKNL
jgi:hypothetical protein